MKRIFKFIIVFAVFILVVTVIWFQIFRSEVSGPVSVEVVSDDGFLKLTMTLEKTKFTTSPREPVKINLTLTNIGDQEITLTFHYKSKFDFMVYDYGQGEYIYMWSWEHVYNGSSIELPEINTVKLKPGEKISELLIWKQNYVYDTTHPRRGLVTKGTYRIEGSVGHGKINAPWFPENPLRFFEYTLPNGTLVRTVLKTPGIKINLV